MMYEDIAIPSDRLSGVTLESPKPVGYFTIGNLCTPVYYGELPNRFHRMMQRIILGIKWDVKK